MALQVWLPLNGDLHNQGLYKTGTINSDNSSTITSGKTGSCMKLTSHAELKYILDFNTTGLSIGGWFKFNQSEIGSVVNNLSYTSSATYPTGNLLGNDNYGGIGLIWNGNNIYSSGSFSSMSIFGALRTGTVNINTGGFNVTFDTWIHIMLTWDPNTHFLSLYKDGILYDRKTLNSFTDGASRILYLNYNGIFGGNGPAVKIPVYCNDIRIYNHCLSEKEIEEISKGLVLHYQLNNGNPNLLSEYVTPGQGAPGVTSTGGRTNYYGKYGIIIPATENADTYFRLFLKQQLVQGTTYTISCYVSGLLPGSYYNFPLFAQGNTSMGVLQLNHNGLCSLTFTMNSSSQSAVTTPEGDTVYVCFMDDAGRTLASGQGAITVNGFKLEQGSNVTNFSSIDNDIIYDASGYNNNGIINDTSITSVNISSKYLNCIKNSQANNSATYLAKGNINMPESSTLTFSWWMNPTSIGAQTSGIFSTSSLELPTDYNTTAANMRDSCFDCCNISGTCVRINVANYLTLNEWHHYALVYNGSKLIFYKDGEQKVTANQTGNLKSFTSIFPFYSKAGGVNRNTSGSLSDFRIYATALTPAQIKKLYETSKIVDGTTVKARDLEVSA